jgi:NAD+ synthase (glutamine-hydrolysing)
MPRATHIDLSLKGVDIIGSGSGSHHELRKLNTRLELMVSATRKCGGVYLYSNQRGCDGGRLYYDGCAMIVCNGEILAQAKQFDVRNVQVIAATVDLDDVRSYRASLPSFGIQAARYNKDSVGDCVVCKGVNLIMPEVVSKTPTSPIELRYHSPEEECCLGPACWLWDYLRRSGATGFFLPLSGTCVVMWWAMRCYSFHYRQYSHACTFSFLQAAQILHPWQQSLAPCAR